MSGNGYFLAGRPLQLTSAKYMHMKMVDALTTLSSIVDNNAIPIIKLQFFGHILCGVKKGSEKWLNIYIR